MNPVSKALWFIENHFAEELTLDDVAKIGGVIRALRERIRPADGKRRVGDLDSNQEIIASARVSASVWRGAVCSGAWILSVREVSRAYLRRRDCGGETRPIRVC